MWVHPPALVEADLSKEQQDLVGMVLGPALNVDARESSELWEIVARGKGIHLCLLLLNCETARSPQPWHDTSISRTLLLYRSLSSFGAFHYVSESLTLKTLSIYRVVLGRASTSTGST
jgi:hypothetical protein